MSNPDELTDPAVRLADAQARHAARRRRRRRRLLPLLATAAVVLVGAPVAYAAYSYQQFTGNITRVDAIPAPTGTKTADADGEAQNILLVGDDHRPAGASAATMQQLGTEDDGGSMNTDTMIVLHIAADGRSASMISMPRDSYVDIPGHGQAKLNAAFAWGSDDGGGATGGAKLLISTVQNLTGLSIDHYVRVSLLGFYDIVDALGPVQVCLNQAAQDAYSGVDLPAGTSTLNAKQSLAFVRQRHGLLRGDLDRQVRQQYFLSVEAKRMLSAGTLLNPGKLQHVLKAVSSSIETDSSLDMLQLAAQMRNLDPKNIRSATIPITGTPTITVNGAPLSIVAVDHAAMPGFIAGIIGPTQAYRSASASTPSSVTVQVVNGSGVTGAGANAAAALHTAGFTAGTPTTAPETTAATTIQYPAGSEAQAKALAATVHGAIVTESRQVHALTLLLGTDGRTPATANSSSGAPDDASAAAGSASSATTSPSPTSTPVGTSYASVPCIN